MANRFAGNESGMNGVALDGVAITPSDTVDLTAYARALYIGGAGDVVVVTPAGTVLTFKGAVVGSTLPVAVRRVNNTSTTATNLVGLL